MLIRKGHRDAAAASRGLTVLVLAALLCAGACRQPPAERTAAPEKVTIAHLRLPHSALVHIAVAKGFFAAEGLEVIEQLHEFGKEALESVLEGRADLATSADTPVMFAIAGGKDLDVVATIASSRKEIGIVARTDRAIARPADLKAKRIGVPVGTSAHYFLGSFLSLAGLETKDIETVDLKPGALGSALRAGEVDAVAIWQPVLRSIAAELGAGGVVFSDGALYSDLICLAGQRGFTRGRPETVKKVLRALHRAEVHLRDYPDASRDAVASAIHADPAAFRELWPLFTFSLSLDQGLLLSLEDQDLWARRSRLLDAGGGSNYFEHLNPDALLAVKPEAMQLIR